MNKLTERGTVLKLIFIAAMLLWPLFYHSSYVLNVMVIAAVYAMLGIGFTLLVGQARQVSLGHAAFFGVGAYTSALLTTKLQVTPLLALIGGGIAAGALAFVLGIPVLRLKGFVLALVTLGLGQIFYVIVREARPITGGLNGLAGIPYLGLGDFSLNDYLPQYYGFWVLVAIAYVFGERAVKARPGRAMRALAASEAAASTLGINTFQWKLTAFVVSGIYAGIGGGLYAFVLSAINPEDFGFSLSVIVMIMTMLGGLGSLFGAITGSILITWLTRSFSGYQEYSVSLYAVTLIVLVICLPGGLAGGLRSDQKEWVKGIFRLGRRRQRSEPALALAQVGAMSAGDTATLAGPGPAAVGSNNGEGSDAGTQGLNQGVYSRRRPAVVSSGEPLLKVEDVNISFGGLRAVNQVSLVVSEGTVAALIGPNGAGKTTLFNAVSGLKSVDAGRIWFAGQEITRLRTADRARLGMARTFQALHIFSNMSVLENVLVGRHRHERAGFTVSGIGLPWQAREEQESKKRAMEALALMGLEDMADRPVSSLPYGQQRLVEISRALATEPRLLLLDEPAAGLNTSERVQLMERVARIRDAGITVLLVEHDMPLVMGISDAVRVLDYGKLIAAGPPEEVQKDPAVIEAYLGASLSKKESYSSSSADSQEGQSRRGGDIKPLIEVQGVSTFYGSIGAIRDVSLQVYPGEIATVLGSNGAGKTTLLRTISGILRPREGHINYQGRDVTRLSAPDISAGGIGHVPEGRHVFPTLSVEDNLRLGAYRRRDKAEVAREYEFVYDLLPVLKERRKQLAGTLSGGEQQMLAIGRTLMGQPQLLLLDEPSMGLAPLIIEHIFETLLKLNQRGLTLLMVEQSAELALSIAHHAFVLQTGQVVLSGTGAELRRDDRVRQLYLGEAAPATAR